MAEWRRDTDRSRAAGVSCFAMRSLIQSMHTPEHPRDTGESADTAPVPAGLAFCGRDGCESKHTEQFIK